MKLNWIRAASQLGMAESSLLFVAPLRAASSSVPSRAYGRIDTRNPAPVQLQKATSRPVIPRAVQSGPSVPLRYPSLNRNLNVGQLPARVEAAAVW